QHLLDEVAAAYRLAGKPDRLAAGPAGHGGRVGAEGRHIDDRERRVEVRRRNLEPGQVVRAAARAHSSSRVSAVYSAADSKPGGSSPSVSSSFTLNNQPEPYGSELTSPGSSSISELTWDTSPSTGE